MTGKFLRLFCLSLFLVILSSCTSLNNEKSSADENTSLQTVPEKTVTSTEFVVKAWVDKSSNNDGKDFVVMASLLKGSFTLGDVMMFASWPDPSADGGVVHCDLLSHHGVGQCVAHTDQLTKGEYVPVAIKFEYQGHYYYGETGFTPE
jgi:hypothetical protein